MHERGIEPQDSGGADCVAGLSRVELAWVKPLLGMLSPGGVRGRLSILIFHRVHPQQDPMFPGEMHATAFRERLGWVRNWFNVLPLDDAVTALSRGALPARALAITFDDGYADNFTVALPILQQLGLPATFFIATDFLDGGRMWNDTVIEAIRAAPGPSLDLSPLALGIHHITTPAARFNAVRAILSSLKYLEPSERRERVDAVASLAGTELPSALMLSSRQVRGLASAGMGIGGHTVSHPILTRIDDAAARREIADGRETLQAITGQPVRQFAYPNGQPGTDYAAAHVRMVKDLGFSAAFSTAWGAARAGNALFELPRFTPWDARPARFAMRMAQNLTRKVLAAT